MICKLIDRFEMSMRILQIRECNIRSRIFHRPSPQTRNINRSLYGTPLRVRQLTLSSNVCSKNRRQVTRMGLFGLGVPELLVIAGVAALLFGPSKLPELGKGLGKTMKNVQAAAKEFESELKKEMESEDDKDDVAKPVDSPAAKEFDESELKKETQSEDDRDTVSKPTDTAAPVTSSTEKET